MMSEKLFHVAIIMDGNGRWAKEQNKPRTYGHQIGTENLRHIAIAAKELGVNVLTLYAFSTENWARPLQEVNYLMSLPEKFFNQYLPELIEQNVKITIIGNWQNLPKATSEVLKKALGATKDNTGLILNLALNYGAKDEIVQTVKNLIKQGYKAEQINEELFEKSLMTQELPAVDLLIRTGGEKRLSNFLLWQIAYSELVFTDVAWPIFSKEDLKQAIDTFSSRERRFGGLK